MNNFVTDLLMRIDQIGQGFSARAYGIVGDEILPVLKIAFVLYVALYGVQLILGTARISVGEFVGRTARLVIILTLTQNWEVFNSLFYRWLSDTPEDVGRAILAASSTGITEPTNGLSMIVATASNAGAALAQQSGYFTILPSLLGGIIMFLAWIVAGIALAILMIAKVAMWVLIGTGPIFIGCMLFHQTRNLGAAWFAQILHYSIIPMFVYVVVAFLIAALNPELAKIEVAVSSSTLALTQLVSFVLLCIAGCMMLVNVTTVAQAITGSFGVNASNNGYMRARAVALGAAGVAGWLLSRGGNSADKPASPPPGGSIQNRSNTEAAMQDKISSFSRPS
ncbi:type IV secretion system protein [Agrobacterium tumefaciens]|nr:type IV secretion system protein [Agrobacterium tumefaciens]TQN58153.1 type IV secretion system protein [Agrobacterium tumefaciens]